MCFWKQNRQLWLLCWACVKQIYSLEHHSKSPETRMKNLTSNFKNRLSNPSKSIYCPASMVGLSLRPFVTFCLSKPVLQLVVAGQISLEAGSSWANNLTFVCMTHLSVVVPWPLVSPPTWDWFKQTWLPRHCYISPGPHPTPCCPLQPHSQLSTQPGQRVAKCERWFF